MPNTTNYSFPTPADTDLVKNGADAIRDLGDAVDTAMNTALGTKKAGMVLLNTTSFSGVSSQAIPTASFSASYQNYRIVLDFTGTLNHDLNMRLRLTTTDDSSSQYQRQELKSGTTSTISSRATSATSYRLGQYNGTDRANVLLDILNPFLARVTGINAFSVNGYASTTPDIVITGGGHNVATSFDGLNFIPSTGTITGNVSVYGYNF